MKYLIIALVLMAGTAQAITCRTDIFNTTLCDNGTKYRTDSFSTTLGSNGDVPRTDSFGISRMTHSDGSSTTCRRNSFGAVRCN